MAPIGSQVAKIFNQLGKKTTGTMEPPRIMTLLSKIHMTGSGSSNQNEVMPMQAKENMESRKPKKPRLKNSTSQINEKSTGGAPAMRNKIINEIVRVEMQTQV